MINDNDLDVMFEQFSRFYRPDPSVRLKAMQMFSQRRLMKGTWLFRQGLHSAKIWFMLSGFAREVSRDEPTGLERTSWFYYAGDFLFSNPGFFSQQLSFTGLEVLSEVVLIEIVFSDLLALRTEAGEVGLVIERLRAECEMKRFFHAADMILLSSKERYLKYYAAHKEIFNVAKHRDIALFLGIKDDGFNRFSH